MPSADELFTVSRRKVLDKKTYENPSDWCEENVPLSSEVSSTEGRMVLTPYQRPLLDLICADEGPSTLLVQKSARIGYTTALLASVAYLLSHMRRHCTIYMPNDGDARDFGKTFIAPLVRDCKPMSTAVDADDQRQAKNLTTKILNGKILRILGAVAAERFRRYTADCVMLDELDGYEADIQGEGDPISLSSRAMRNSPFKRLVAGSTPTNKSTSMIHHAISNVADVLWFRFPCPECGEKMEMRWETIRFDPDGTSEERSRTAVCASKCCGGIWKHSRLQAALAKGAWETLDGVVRLEDGILWRNGGQSAFPRELGFFINALYSPWYAWSDAVYDFLQAQGDVQKLRVWTNTVLGEAWDDAHVSTDEFQLRRETENLEVPPKEVLDIIVAVDVQKTWLSAMTCGFGMGEECWVLDRTEFHGGTDNPKGSAWEALRHWLREKTWMIEGGRKLRPSIVLVDSSYQTDVVYHVVDGTLPAIKVRATKGSSQGWNAPLLKTPPSTARLRSGRVVPFYLIGTDQSKLHVHQRISAKAVHFASTLEPEVFGEITAEQLVPMPRNPRKLKWVMSTSKSRNEALDTLAMSFAGLRIVDPAWMHTPEHRQAAAQWVKGERMKIKEQAAKIAETKLEKPKPDVEETPERFASRMRKKKRTAGSWL